MLKRNIQINFRISEEEYSKFIKHIKKSGLSTAGYLRHLINRVIPNDAPPPDYFSMMKELYSICKNLNQIAQKAHSSNVIDEAKYDENVLMLEKTIMEITKAVILPKEAL